MMGAREVFRISLREAPYPERRYGASPIREGWSESVPLGEWLKVPRGDNA